MIKHMKIDKASCNCSTSLEIFPFLVLMETYFSSGIKKVIGFFIYLHEKVKQKCPSAIDCGCPYVGNSCYPLTFKAFEWYLYEELPYMAEQVSQGRRFDFWRRWKFTPLLSTHDI